ncbi:hypothetical protein [Symbiobacterium terraclitae]|uniref:hypothetical protein n=1 Tax=Symbiobacterium terraclitae TaxID=557451 RepID=UPI0035B50F5B
MGRLIRMVHCLSCHPDGGDIDRDNFHAYAYVWMDEDGTERYPICPHCGQEMSGRYVWRNGHSADNWVPAD